jgi:2-methylcitrate dehydratase PrpD
MEIAATFANFVKNTRFEDVDESVIEHIKKLTLKQVMGMLLGSSVPPSQKFIHYFKDNIGKPECGVYGCGFKTDVAQAALLNGFFGHASEMEDDMFPGGGISDVTTWPARKCRTESPCGPGW